MDIDIKETGLRSTGTAGADHLERSGFSDILTGLAADDTLSGDRDADQLAGGAGADRLIGGSGLDTLRGEEGDDALDGGVGEDRLEGGLGDDLLAAGDGADALLGGDGDDRLQGDAGDDRLLGELGRDALAGGDGADALEGQDGDDTLEGGFGADALLGGEGNDRLLSRSDAGEPAPASGGPRALGEVPLDRDGDVLTGGRGADVFRFELLMGARPAVAWAAAGDDGRVDWRAVATAGGGARPHDHWVGGIGDDTITDFSAKAGDRIEIAGHAVAVRDIAYAGADTVIRLWSRGDPVQEGDALGTITVRGVHLTAADLRVDGTAALGAFATLAEAPGLGGAELPGTVPALRQTGTAGADALAGTGFRDVLTGREGDDLLDGGANGDRLQGDGGTDTLLGGDGRDTLLGGAGEDSAAGGAGDGALGGGAGADLLHGEDGADAISGGAGADRLCGDEGDDMLTGGGGEDSLWGGDGDDLLQGGLGDDVLLGRSDAGEPDIALPDPKKSVLVDGVLVQPKVFGDAPMPPSDDVLTGGAGADTFRFETFINARPGIARQFADAQGVVDWMAVAMQANQAHYHWVDGFGDDVITDFSRAEGDRIELAGHTILVKRIEYRGADSVVHLWSINNGGRAAHNEDLLGTITVAGVRVTEADLLVDRTPFYGAYATIPEGPFMADDCGILPGGGHDAMTGGHDPMM